MTFGVKPGECGMIVFTFADHARNEFIDLAAYGFTDTTDLASHWNRIEKTEADTSFIADLYDEKGDLIEDRTVTAELIESITGKKIGILIEEGRLALAAVLETIRKRPRPAAA